MNGSVLINQLSYTKEEVLNDIWNRLVNGTLSAQHPFHCPTIATICNDEPEVRTVVLRKVLPIERQLLFHTDYRSPKIEQIQKNNSISWLFYDSKSRIQLRIKSLATLHYQDDISRQRWNDTKTESRKCYFVQPAPSTASLFPTDGLPSSYYEKEKSKEQNEIGYQHFVVVRTQVKEIDWLYLHHSGHRRARFIYNKDEVHYQWLIP